MSTIKYSLFTLLVIYGLTSCEYTPADITPTSNEVSPSIDYSKMYVLGGTYSSGLMDGALYKTGQSYSYPNLLASQIEEILNDSVFTQAVVESEVGVNAEPFMNDQSRFIDLYFETSTDFYPNRRTVDAEPFADWTFGVNQLNNFSFPGLTLGDLNNPANLSNDNPYVGRVTGLTENPVDAIISQNPEIIIIDLGKDELFNYAFYGASGDDNPDINSITDQDLISNADFQSVYSEIVNRFVNETDAQIFVINFPEILKTPYFNTLSWFFELEIFDIGFVGFLEAHYSTFNSWVARYNYNENPGGPLRPRVNFDLDNFPNPISRARVIHDETLFDAQLNDGTILDKWRQMSEGELLGYNLEPFIFYENQLGGAVPLPDNLVLTLEEIQVIESRNSDFNFILTDIAALSNRIHLIDINTQINKILDEEFFFDGVQLSAKLDQYSIYSADGYTFNARGNALIANELIKRLNIVTGSSIPTLNLNDFPGIPFSLNTPETGQ